MRIPAVGARATRSLTVTDGSIELFARLSGDRNPVHFDDAFARRIGFDGRIAHGAVTASLLSALLGMDLPGPGSVFLEQRVRFLAQPADRVDLAVVREHRERLHALERGARVRRIAVVTEGHRGLKERVGEIGVVRHQLLGGAAELVDHAVA